MDCGLPPVIVNGYLDPGATVYGTIRKINCNQNYQIFPDKFPVVQCQDDGNWYKEANCIAKRDCEIENGWIASRQGGRVNCNLGYERQGPEYVNCSNLATPVTTKCVKCNVSVQNQVLIVLILFQFSGLWPASIDCQWLFGKWSH